MSWFSNLTGINWHIGASTVTNVEGIVLKGIEQSSPLATKLIDIGEFLIANPPTSPAAAVTDLGHVVLVLDSNAITQIDTNIENLLTAFATKHNIPTAEVALFLPEGIAALNAGLEDIGFPAPVVSSTSSPTTPVSA